MLARFVQREIDIIIVPLLEPVGAQVQRFGLGARRLVGADHFIVCHQIENDAAPPQGCFRTQMRRIGRRRLQNPRKQRALRQGQLARGHAEVPLRRRFDAVVAAAEVDAVEVAGEDLFLGKHLFEPVGEDRFVNLAVERLDRG